jgi:hypothetical protein
MLPELVELGPVVGAPVQAELLIFMPLILLPGGRVVEVVQRHSGEVSDADEPELRILLVPL